MTLKRQVVDVDTELLHSLQCLVRIAIFKLIGKFLLQTVFIDLHSNIIR